MHRFNYWPRFKTGLQYHDLDVEAIGKLVDVVRKRASGDRAVDEAFSKIMNILEPKGCQKSHCTYHGSGGFCCCGKNMVPSKCKEHREYLARRYEKWEKVYKEGRELGAKIKAGQATANNEIYKDDYYKKLWFEVGQKDGYAELPMRSIPDGKLKLEWGIPDENNLQEFMTFSDYTEAVYAAHHYELSWSRIIRSYLGKGPSYLICRYDRSEECLKQIAEAVK